MKRRVLTVALALVLAVIGTAGVLVYVHQADARAVAGMKPVSVLVAQGTIPSGTSAASAARAGLLRSENLPASSVPPDAVRSITPDLGSLVTSTQVAPGELLLRPVLVAATDAAGGLALPAGMVAVTISLCVPAAVAGNLQPGSQVMVFTTVDSGGGSSGGLSESAACSGQHQQAPASAHTSIVLSRVEVLSIGTAGASGQASSQTASTSFGAQQNSASADPAGVMLLTLAVSPGSAQRLIQLTEAGLPYLALLK